MVTFPLVIKILDGLILLFRTFPYSCFKTLQIYRIRCLNSKQLLASRYLLKFDDFTLNLHIWVVELPFTLLVSKLGMILQIRFFSGSTRTLRKQFALILLYFHKDSIPNWFIFYYLLMISIPDALNYFIRYAGRSFSCTKNILNASF